MDNRLFECRLYGSDGKDITNPNLLPDIHTCTIRLAVSVARGILDDEGYATGQLALMYRNKVAQRISISRKDR